MDGNLLTADLLTHAKIVLVAIFTVAIVMCTATFARTGATASREGFGLTMKSQAPVARWQHGISSTL